MQVYTELTPPTAVTHSLTLPFLSADANNLIVAKSSLLQIFSITTTFEPRSDESRKHSQIADRRVNDDEGLESSFLGADSILLRSNEAAVSKLILVAECPLSGTITSISRIKSTSAKSGGEVLLLSFKNAKLVLVEWDPERYSISTISVHLYEQEDSESSPWSCDLDSVGSYLTADPAGRCAALKFGTRSLAILPIHQQGDEDIAMDDWDEDLDGPRPVDEAPTKAKVEDIGTDVPYSASFVLRLSTLNTNLIFPKHLVFLYEYREPTFGVLSSTRLPSSSVKERTDCMTYTVYTLDLYQKASTTILSVTGLPSDLFKIIALPTPVGGSLLVGANELIHVDQSGKTTGIAVNMYTKLSTSYALADQSELQLRLENSIIEILSVENGDMLVVLESSDSLILSFHMDGRSVSGMSLCPVSAKAGGKLFKSSLSCSCSLPDSCIFLGSEQADSVLLSWAKQIIQPVRKRGGPRAAYGLEADDIDDSDGEDIYDEDDLYGDDTPMVETNGAASVTKDYVFKVDDTLINIAPITDVSFGRSAFEPCSEAEKNSEGLVGELELVAATGSHNSGALVILKREVEPKVIGKFDFPQARGMWTVSAKTPAASVLQPDKEKTVANGDYGSQTQFDSFMIVSRITAESAEESNIYSLTSASFEPMVGTEFESEAGATIEAGTLGNGMRIVQVLRSEVRSYDGSLGLGQIIPMFDEDTEAEPKIISASFADPYLLLVRDDASIFMISCDENNELEEMERGDVLLTTKWMSGSLYTDTSNLFGQDYTGTAKQDGSNVFMFLLTSTGALHIYQLPDLTKPVYVAEGLSSIPPILSSDFVVRRAAARETLTEIAVADLGDQTYKSPYLILRAANDDLTIYHPFRVPSESPCATLSSTLNFLKSPNSHLPKNPDVSAEETAISDPRQSQRNTPMRVVSNLAGYSAVFLPGGSPSFIFKSAKSMPRVLDLRGKGVRGMSSFHTEGCDRGFIYLDTGGVARVAQLPPKTCFAEIGMAMRKVELGENVHAIAYHPPSSTYVVGTIPCEDTSEADADEDQNELEEGEETQFDADAEKEKPKSKQNVGLSSRLHSFIRLINPLTWAVVDSVELEKNETVTCISTINLEISEITHERKQLVVVGTAIDTGEIAAVKGNIRVYDVSDVVPERDRPETNKKLKEVAKEEISRGPVTTISSIGSQGFMIVAHGQKCMVRGLKEDGTLLPVAFMDMNCYTSSMKELKGTGLVLQGDVRKGVYFTGYTEEPYKLMRFGKSTSDLEVIGVEFLPDGKDLFIVATDIDGDLHVLQFDPEHPKTLAGALLLHRTSFALGAHLPTTMTLLPRTIPTAILPASPDAMDIAKDEAMNPSQQILLTSLTGTISLLAPLTEPQYRRLSTLSNHLITALSHPCGLNPKAYRISQRAAADRFPGGGIGGGMGIGGGGRAIVDGRLVQRWLELASQRRAEVAGRVGVGVEEIRDELEMLGSGLGYL